MTRVLLTGFEPFGGERVNPSWQAVWRLAAAPPDGCETTAVQLPCAFGDSLQALRTAVERTAPEVVVCVGQAGGRADLTVERVAVNVNDAAIPDNAGRQPIDAPVVDWGPVGYFATLPVKACVAGARAAGVPASVSQTAGTYVCNHVFYGLMHLIATERPALRGGFVHIPYAPEQVLDRALPSMSVTLAVEGLRAVVAAAVARREDIAAVGGATH